MKRDFSASRAKNCLSRPKSEKSHFSATLGPLECRDVPAYPVNNYWRVTAVHDQLRDQLVALLPPAARIVAHGWQPWASASFAGARHWFDVRPHVDDDASAWAKLLTQHEWQMSDCFVADAALDASEPGADWRIELLTVDDS